MLLKNALDAIDEAGKIQIITGPCETGAFIEIRDNGSGIDSKEMSVFLIHFYDKRGRERNWPWAPCC